MLAEVQKSQSLWRSQDLDSLSAAKDKMHLESDAITANSPATPDLTQASDTRTALERGSQTWLLRGPPQGAFKYPDAQATLQTNEVQNPASGNQQSVLISLS